MPVNMKALSPDAVIMLDRGVTANMIARMWNMKASIVRNKIEKAPVFGSWNGEPTYRMPDVAPFLVSPTEAMVTNVMRLNHMDLPPMLRKEYWAGQESMLKVREREGQLWNTAVVMEYVGEAFKEIRLSVLMAGDNLERTQTLTDRQRDEVKAIFDGLLANIYERITASFSRLKADYRGRKGAATAAQRPSIAEQVSDL